ncbi:MAG: hypothetical protein LYZ69_01640 [Nitrososphaerales archaeon]|nr:hypothetical protein [Nitrososphaerales archaeon]
MTGRLSRTQNRLLGPGLPSRTFPIQPADAFDHANGWVKRLVAQHKPRAKGTQRVSVPPM